MNFNAKNIFWGLFWIIIGTLFLGAEMHWFSVDWDEVLKLWPLLLIFLGAMMVFGKTHTTSVILVIVGLLIAIPSLLVRNAVHKFNDRVEFFDDDHHSYNDNDDDDKNDKDDSYDDNFDGKVEKQNFSEPLEANTKTASFKLEGGAVEFIIKGTTGDLIQAKTESSFEGFSLKKVQNGSNVDLSFNMKDTKKHHVQWDNGDIKVHNKAEIQLNTTPEWDMKLDLGAGHSDFDLSDYKVRKLKINAGAAGVEVKMGDKLDDATLDVDAGAAGIDIKIPESVGCRIEGESFLAGKDFNGFIDKGDYYETPNYDKSTKKIKIKYNGAFAGFSVKRY